MPRRSRLSTTRRGDPQSHQVTPVSVVTASIGVRFCRTSREKLPAGRAALARRMASDRAPRPAACTIRSRPEWIRGTHRRPASTSVRALATNTKVFQRPRRPGTRAPPPGTASRRTDGPRRRGARRRGRASGPGSIHPYSVSAVVAGAPRRTMRAGFVVHEGGHLGDLVHEGLFLEDEVVRRKHGHGRVGCPAQDPVRRQEHARRRAAVGRLEQDGRADRPGIAAARWPRGLDTDDDGALGRDARAPHGRGSAGGASGNPSASRTAWAARPRR